MTYPEHGDPDPNTIKDDPHGPNKFVPGEHPAFPGQEPPNHARPGDTPR